MGSRNGYNAEDVKLDRFVALKFLPDDALGRSTLAVVALNLLQRFLVEFPATITIPLHDRVIFVGLLNCAKVPSWLS